MKDRWKPEFFPTKERFFEKNSPLSKPQINYEIFEAEGITEQENMDN